MDKIVLDHDKLLGFDHPSNLQAKVGDKNISGDPPQAKLEVAPGRPAPEPADR